MLRDKVPTHLPETFRQPDRQSCRALEVYKLEVSDTYRATEGQKDGCIYPKLEKHLSNANFAEAKSRN